MKPIPFTDILQNHLGRTNMAPQGENRHQNTGMAEIKSPPTNCILYSENVVLLDKRRNRIPAPSDYNTMLPKDGRAFTMAGRNDRSGKFDKGISPTAVKPPDHYLPYTQMPARLTSSLQGQLPSFYFKTWQSSFSMLK